MTGTRVIAARLFAAGLGLSAVAANPPARMPAAAPVVPGAVAVPSLVSSMPAPAMSGYGVQPTAVPELVRPPFREPVTAVMRKPTITARGTSDEVVCRPEVYEWLLERPDRVALAWTRLKVPCVPITPLGDGRFRYTDDLGSEITWQTAGRFADGRVWYATGKVKPSPLLPTVPVKAVAVVTYTKTPAADGSAAVKPVAQVYLQTDSRAANLALRVLGPTAPKLAEEGAEQLLFFFAGIARYLHVHPNRIETLLAPQVSR